MAVAVQIDITNYNTLMVESTQGRAGTPDGNIYFDTVNNRVEFITVEELPQVDLGAGLEANPLTNHFGITPQAWYALGRKFRRTNQALRTYFAGAKGKFKYAGAFAAVNGVKPASDATSTTGGDDRNKLRGGGLVEYAATGDGQTDIDRIYFGARSLNPINAASTPFYLLVPDTTEASRQAATPVNFFRNGDIDEMVQVFGTTANGDTTAGNFDYTAYTLILDVRPFGRTFGETTSGDAKIPELHGFSTGFGIGDSVNKRNVFSLADVFGANQIAPWSGMAYTSFATPQTATGFTTADGLFDVIISNANGGTLDEVLAFADALMLQDTDQDADATGVYLPKRGAPLYTINTDGKVVTKRGVLFSGIAASDRQGIIQTDNTGAGKVYPFIPEVRVSVSDAWANDVNAWAQCMYTNGALAADFNTAGAVIVQDETATPVVFTSADVLGVAGAYYLSFAYLYDSNAQAGLAAGVDKPVVFLAEGDGGAEAALVYFTITRSTLVSASALSGAETNL